VRAVPDPDTPPFYSSSPCRLFYAHWPDKNGRGRTTLLVEQVSHHPPITAYTIENKTKGLKLVGHNAQKTTFSSGSIIVKQLGHAVLTVGGSDHYLITLPRLRIDGLWYGSPYIELVDTSAVIGGGHTSVIEYKGKGYFSGKSHSFKATITPITEQSGQQASAPQPAASSGGWGWGYGYGYSSSTSSSKNASSSSLASGPECVVEGTWHESSTWTKGKSPSGSSLAGTKFHDIDSAIKEEAILVGGGPALKDGQYEQTEWETRRLWALVAKGIREGDFELASREKTRIENEQRQMRKDEQAAGKTWPLKHFRYEENDALCK